MYLNIGKYLQNGLFVYLWFLRMLRCFTDLLNDFLEKFNFLAWNDTFLSNYTVFWSRCSFSMMVKWAHDCSLKANDGKMLVYDGKMLVNDGEMLVNDGEISMIIHSISPSLTSIMKLEVNHHSLIWPSLRSCTDCFGVLIILDNFIWIQSFNKCNEYVELDQ